MKMNLKVMSRIGKAFIVCTVFLSTSFFVQASNFPFPEKTQRVLFLGNSITYSGEYITDIETYFRLCYPDRVLEWINAGLPSETVSCLSEVGHANGDFPRPCIMERIERVMETVRPDVVFVCYGMNDGIYLPLDEGRFEAYRNGMQQLDSILQHHEVAEIIYLTPPIHVDKEKGLNGYNLVLDVYANWLLSQRESMGWRVIDLHFPMKRFLEKQRETDPEFILARDGVHPQELGHWLMAREILVGLSENRAAEFQNFTVFLDQFPKGEAIYKLIAERQKMMKDAWLTLSGHKRPRMKTGLPMPEARLKYMKMETQILKASNTTY